MIAGQCIVSPGTARKVNQEYRRLQTERIVAIGWNPIEDHTPELGLFQSLVYQTMAQISEHPWSADQNFQHTHCTNNSHSAPNCHPFVVLTQVDEAPGLTSLIHCTYCGFGLHSTLDCPDHCPYQPSSPRNNPLTVRGPDGVQDPASDF